MTQWVEKARKVRYRKRARNTAIVVFCTVVGGASTARFFRVSLVFPAGMGFVWKQDGIAARRGEFISMDFGVHFVPPVLLVFHEGLLRRVSRTMMLVLVVNLNGVVCSSSRKRLFELLELDLAFFHALLGGNALVELDRSDHGLEAHAQQEELDCRFFGVESMVGEETDSEDHEPAEDLGVPDLEAHFLLLLEDHLGKVHEKVGRITENLGREIRAHCCCACRTGFLGEETRTHALGIKLGQENGRCSHDVRVDHVESERVLEAASVFAG
mmetsp:Transcript_25817/g.55212  ORF Transcript_25817/g.55212 Transcript_25817/m.55212 type:complete len:270 (+) Transcript_25817:1358-2167(+)